MCIIALLMIPQFPQFIKLSFEHKPHIEKHILRHLPYSDFNFTSLLSWSGDETHISTLNGNLVLKFRDYLTNEPFYTFIGVHKVNDTIQTLLQESIKNNLHPKLKLIPEVVLKTDPKILNHFDIQEDRDNFDYIYQLEEMKELKGNKFGEKRHHINKFKKLYNSSYRLINLADAETQQAVLDLFHRWLNLKGREKKEAENELAAIKKIFQFAKDLKLVCIGLYIDGKLVGFSVNEMLTNGYAINFFEKADTNYQGIYPYLRQITANHLAELGCIYLSHEQDLGIEGLRKSKMSYHPHFFLKKYTISHKTV